MIGAVVITHASLAQSLIEAAEAITGKLEGVMPVSISKSDSTEGVRRVIKQALKDVSSGKGAIIFTDMFGGTPTNIALSLYEEGRVEIITGVNLPLLIKFVSHRADKPLSELVLILKEHGSKSIVLAGDMLRER